MSQVRQQWADNHHSSNKSSILRENIQQNNNQSRSNLQQTSNHIPSHETIYSKTKKTSSPRNLVSSQPQYIVQNHQYVIPNIQKPYIRPQNYYQQPANMHSTQIYQTYPIKSFQEDFVIYCPVCKVDYFNSQVRTHMKKHYMADSYDFRTEDKDLSVATVDSTKFIPLTSYPLVEPLQFDTSELDEVSKQDQYKFVVNENYDKIKAPRQFSKSQAIVQTLSRPPLQYAPRNTNLYNCFDNCVNQNQHFSTDDIWKNNEGISSKRTFNEWEDMIVRNKK